ncbi:ATM1 mitochondrial ABC transporter [Encephalitozoon intestinalis ATCC 50506]|uniref:ATM1 mitochondrial ABC transporter n=1 Tax=Encephalitozoon intestinalis (strain ATCC 50506) TaxID=876142 RepID=E0S9Y6_ENCIT|nr:ATM1 mitochondrial ABC transporter [Encephalitozoon intestinalis ATCC 50506]ADM12608.1 ATM1 mitochondrial ABC transporter [Encephalitozoon intestinalis ATCC 50506]UTX46466.1 antigen peptide transporter 1 [Encephalitozoon intestinalis]
MGGKKKVSELQTLSIIVRKYILGIPQARIIVFPVLLSIFAGKYFEVKVASCISYISEGLDLEEVPRSRIIMFLVISLTGIIFTELQGFVFVSAIQYVYRYTLRTTFEYFIRMETEMFESYGSGTIQSIITRKSKAISDFVEVSIQNLFPVVASLTFVGLEVYLKLGVLASFIVALAVAAYGFMTISIALRRNRIRGALNSAENAASNIVYDTLSNHESVMSFNNYCIEVRRYDGKLMEIERFGTNLFRGLYILNMLQKLIFAFLNSSMIALGVYGLLSSKMDGRVLIFYVTTSRILLINLNNLGYTYCRFTEAMLNAREVLSEDYDLKTNENISMVRFGKNIVFKNVRLYYGDKKILNDVNLTIKKGDKVAIVGSNGSGKSTILKTFLRFNRYQGSICIDGISIDAIENGSFRRIIGYVPQNSSLFNETVMYNIKYGNPNVSDYTVVELAKRFNIHDSIMRLEKGYFTNVGEAGRHISGGERQKIIILRALLRRPEILAMDEPTSNLDKEAEIDIIKNIIDFESSVTVMAIVHNLDLLPLFNKVCFVDRGSVRMIDQTGTSSESAAEGLRSYEIPGVK